MHKILKWLKHYRTHVVVWTAYVSYEALVILLLFGVVEDLITYIVNYLLVLAFLFFNNVKGMRWAFKDRQPIFLRMAVVLVAEMAVYVCCGYFINLLLKASLVGHNGLFTFRYRYLLSTSFRASLYLGFSFSYYYLLIYKRERLRNAALQRQHLRSRIREQRMVKKLSSARNAFLKAQINPHFLFNTLDFVYHHINTKSAVAADAIVNLAEMMRYALSSDKDFIMLGDEIEQVEHLLYLYQLRKEHQLNIKFIYSAATMRLKLIPLVLLTLVENMFKHGNLSDPLQTAYIKIGLADNELNIETYNLLKTTAVKTKASTGLRNIESRLKHAYGTTMRLHCIKTDHYFNVKLSLPVKVMPEINQPIERSAAVLD